MSRFWEYLGGTVVRPHNTFERILIDPHQLLHSLSALLLIGGLYTLTVIALAIKQVPIFAPPWLNLPTENYYFWEIFFAAAVYLVAWVLAGGIAHLLSKMCNGNGTYEGTLACLGFAFTLPSFVTWLPETIGAVLYLSNATTPQQWIELTSQKLSWWQTVAVIIPTIAITGTFVFIFIR